MTHATTRRRLLQATALTPAAMLAGAAWSRTSTDTEAVVRLEGSDAEGRPVRLSALRGRVVLVFHWRTGCAVCRDKMHELRANLIGWQGQAFSLIGVNADARRKDWLDYEQLVASAVPITQRFPSIWSGDPSTVDSLGPATQWPTAILIDKSGRPVERYVGRIPAAAWDRIAELL
ncbi:TlpA family protein disulfide reductase [Hydrogenophaga luteola]|uniref:TlpA family protein disulfide reductase n=1 Tax=Hydrogenophaga luteola TaxID=1591122 RepID=A0ABV7VYX3_9BURK